MTSIPSLNADHFNVPFSLPATSINFIPLEDLNANFPHTYEVNGNEPLIWAFILASLLPSIENTAHTLLKFKNYLNEKYLFNIDDITALLKSYDGTRVYGAIDIQEKILHGIKDRILNPYCEPHSVVDDIQKVQNTLRQLSQIYRIPICLIINKEKECSLFGEEYLNQNELICLKVEQTLYFEKSVLSFAFLLAQQLEFQKKPLIEKQSIPQPSYKRSSPKVPLLEVQPISRPIVARAIVYPFRLIRPDTHDCTKYFENLINECQKTRPTEELRLLRGQIENYLLSILPIDRTNSYKEAVLYAYMIFELFASQFPVAWSLCRQNIFYVVKKLLYLNGVVWELNNDPKLQLLAQGYCEDFLLFYDKKSLAIVYTLMNGFIDAAQINKQIFLQINKHIDHISNQIFSNNTPSEKDEILQLLEFIKLCISDKLS